MKFLVNLICQVMITALYAVVTWGILHLIGVSATFLQAFFGYGIVYLISSYVRGMLAVDKSFNEDREREAKLKKVREALNGGEDN